MFYIFQLFGLLSTFLNVVVACRYTETVIDVDGSGPIPPVAVRCEFFPDGRNITYVDHSQMESTRVRIERGSIKEKAKVVAAV